MSNRLLKVKSLLKEQNLDAILVSSPPTITYLTNYGNFSTIEREAYLLVTKNKQFVITDGRYSEAVAEKVDNFQLIEISAVRSLKQIFKDLAKTCTIKKLGIEEDSITITEQKMLSDCFDDLNHWSATTLRVIKDSNEIDTIKKACELGDRAFEFILKKLKHGVTEKEIAFELELFIKKQGADLSFPTIVAFGKNSSVPHHQTGNQKLNKNSFVLLDYGVKIDNYCSDMTRTLVFGKATSEQKKIHQTVLDAQQKAIEYLSRVGPSKGSDPSTTPASEVDKIARDYIISQGYPTIPHSLGHGIGIEVHEHPRLSPNSKDKLEPGMVFSIEPGIYLPGFGGVRIEDLVVLEKKSVKELTKSPKQLLEI